MAHPERFELPTSWFEAWRYNPEFTFYFNMLTLTTVPLIEHVGLGNSLILILPIKEPDFLESSFRGL